MAVSGEGGRKIEYFGLGKMHFSRGKSHGISLQAKSSHPEGKGIHLIHFQSMFQREITCCLLPSKPSQLKKGSA